MALIVDHLGFDKSGADVGEGSFGLAGRSAWRTWESFIPKPVADQLEEGQQEESNDSANDEDPFHRLRISQPESPDDIGNNCHQNQNQENDLNDGEDHGSVGVPSTTPRPYLRKSNPTWGRFIQKKSYILSYTDF